MKFLNILLLTGMSMMNTPDFKKEKWFNHQWYPFHSNYINIEGKQMHYVDEGQGETVLFIHGTPSWSFLYREQIKALSQSYRCIAPDHIGFGLSDKFKEINGSPQWHSQNLERLVDSLQLDNITLVVHDFGGPIGLSFALRNPQKIKRIVLFNTWLWETASNPEAQKVNKLLNSGMGKFLYLNMNLSPKVLLKQGFYNKKALSKDMHKHYTKVFPNKDSRYSLLRIGQSMVGSSDWYQQQWEQMEQLADKPMLILWGTKDRFLGPEYLNRWKQQFPKAHVNEFDCGHFVQEEQPEQVTKAMESFSTITP